MVERTVHLLVDSLVAKKAEKLAADLAVMTAVYLAAEWVEMRVDELVRRTAVK